MVDTELVRDKLEAMRGKHDEKGVCDEEVGGRQLEGEAADELVARGDEQVDGTAELFRVEDRVTLPSVELKVA